MADREVLVYKDLVLRESDLSILREPCYLNDQIIGFYFSYLHSLFNSADILFIQPSVSFWLTNAENPENVKDLVEPSNLPSKKLVFFPVNDGSDLEGGDNGTHWSLLVFYRDMHEFVHHDSIEGVNSLHAMKLYDAVKAFVGAAVAGFKECNSTPQQMNGYDCGIYVMAIARAICQWFSSLKKHVNASVELTMRTEVIKLIEDLRLDDQN